MYRLGGSEMWRWILFLTLSAFLAGPAHAAQFLICTPSGETTVELRDDAAAPPGCQAKPLPVSADEVAWVAALPRAPKSDEVVAVIETSDGKRRLELRPARPAAARPAALPLGANLLRTATRRPYGTEGRAAVRLADTGLSLTCAAGRAPAGLVLEFPDARLPRGANLRLTATHRGDAVPIDVVRAGADAPGRGRLDAASALRTSRIPIDSALAGRAVAVVLPCPPQGAQLHLSDLRLESAADPRATPLTAWAWQPALWRSSPDALLVQAEAKNIRRLHISVEVARGQVTDAPALARFVRAAAARGIAIDAVEGDPRMVRPDGRTHALARARAIAAYQRAAAPPERLSTIQYDVEPYLLPEFGADPAATLAAWSTLLRDLAQTLGAPIDAVIPFWLLNTPDGAAALDALAGRLSALTVMAYRTDPALVTVFAEPALAWGRAHDVPVRVALEAGPLADETERLYAAAPAGPLALVESANGAAVIALRTDRRLPNALAPAGPPTLVRAAKISFLGDEAQLRATAAALLPHLSAWPAFAGLSLHGLF